METKTHISLSCGQKLTLRYYFFNFKYENIEFEHNMMWNNIDNNSVQNKPHAEVEYKYYLIINIILLIVDTRWWN